MELNTAKKVHDAQMNLEKTKYRAEIEKTEGDIKMDLLEKHQKAMFSSETKLIEIAAIKPQKLLN